MGRGRDDAESVSEAMAQSEGNDSNSGGGCFLILARVALLVLAAVGVMWL